jgi:S1-C subfamily serine protease
MTGTEFRRAASFVVACVAAGLALAALAVLIFPELGGNALARLGAGPLPAPAAVTAAPVTAPTPAPPTPGAAAGGGDSAVTGPGTATTPTTSIADVVGPQPPNFSYSQAVRASSPAVVNIYTARVVTERLTAPGIEQFLGGPVQPRYRQRVQNALGSGVIVDRAGHIITNNHVIEGASQIRVQLADGRSDAAQVIGRDPDTDLAVLQIGLKNVPVMRLGRSDTMQVGDLVLAIGNPLGLSQTVTHGIVSAKERAQLGVATYESFIQTDAAINEGNSGGALVNGRGELVGINTAVLGKQIGAEGIGVAIPVELVRGVMQEILTHGRVIRGWIGISPLDVNERIAQQFGLPLGAVVIASIAQDSPAAQAGLRPGDILVSIDGIEVRSAQATLTQVATRRPGATLRLAGTRGSQAFTLSLPVREPPVAR